MNRKEQPLVGLDIGSAKVCALVAELEEEAVRFVSLGAAESRGMRRGLIVNLDAAVGSIRRAVEAAEAVAGAPIESATIGVAGGHIRGVNSRGGITLGSRPRDVEREDVRRAVEAARGVHLPEDREVLHVLPQEFFLDGQDHIRDPVGMVGTRLEAEVHLVTASTTATQNVITAVNRAGVLVTDTVLEPMASADACLSDDERELGCCLLDIGGGSTDIVVYAGGVLRFASAVPVGGDHFTNDLAIGLRTPIPEAERIKREHASAWGGYAGDAAIEIASVGDRPPRTIFARSLGEIVEPRAQELAALVRDELARAGMDAVITAGLVLTGGGSRLRGLAELFEAVFALPVRAAGPRGIEGMTEEVAQPEYATAVGLLLHAARARRLAAHRPGTLAAKLKSLFAGTG